MFPETVRIVLLQYSIQAILALIIMLILRKFYRQYQNKYFRFWSLSWMALSINMLGSSVTLANAFLLPLTNPFRLVSSIITVAAGFIQLLWLFMGSYELSRDKKFNTYIAKIISICIIPIAIILVLGFYADTDPDASALRIFLRVGIKSFLAGIIFIISAIFLAKKFQTGIGIKFIIISFLCYGILQFNFFIVSIAEINNHEYAAQLPYFMGDVDLFLQCIMGLGMIISVLEIEQDSLKKANNELDTFLYRSSHDLRAPLTTISGIVQVLKYEEDEEKKNNYLNLIDERVDQADNVIKDIITLRKGQKLSLNIKEIDLEKEIVKEIDLLKSPVKKMPDFKLETIGDQVIQTDAERLHTVLTNVLSNCIKYHNYDQENPWIKIQSNRNEEGIKLTISDNGSGIEKKHLSKIFDMFYRANKSSSGSGLGLYLVKDALRVMKGSIEVHSEEKIGTDFHLFIRDVKPESV